MSFVLGRQAATDLTNKMGLVPAQRILSFSEITLVQETKMYPSRLAATAWHLAGNKQGRIVGFSGVCMHWPVLKYLNDESQV